MENGIRLFKAGCPALESEISKRTTQAGWVCPSFLFINRTVSVFPHTSQTPEGDQP
jgi:hypothetical protein